MIAIDSSSLIAFLSNEKREKDTDLVEAALDQKQAVLPPVVLTELLSDPKLLREVKETFKEIPSLPLSEGFWERAGLLRAKMIGKRLKARLADTLITQTCLDHNVPLITRDTDFRHFQRHAGLKLLA